MNTIKILTLSVIFVLYWGCTEDTPLGISPHELDTPDSNPTIPASDYTNGTNFSTGYYNGKIRSDRTQLEWTASTDNNFLCYKIFRAAGYEFEGSDISEGFEGGSLPSGWTEYGDNGGWYVTDSGAYDGGHAIRTNLGYYDADTLEKTIPVPQNANVFISFFSKGVNDGNGYFYINGSLYEYWGYDDYYGSNWNYSSEYYYTGTNTEITLQWIYGSQSYGYGVLDNIEISGLEIGDLSYSLIETLNDKTTTTFMDTTLTQNQYYTYKIANIIDTGVPTVDDIAVKTPKWQAPNSVIVNGLSPEVVELSWVDNTESETSFKIYIDTMDVNLWDYVAVSSTTANQDNTTKVISGLSSTAQYRFSIMAKNTWEDDTPLDYSSSFVFQFDPPSYLSANQQSGSKLVNLTWYDNSSLENGFKIERDTGSGFELLATVDADSTSYTDTDTTDFEYDSTYTYRIRAYNDYSGTVYTDYSSIASVTLSETSGIFVDFEDGQLPDGWSATYYDSNGYGPYDGGWFVSSSAEYEGNYGIATPDYYYYIFDLTATISVPQYTDVTISFYTSEPYGSGDGDLYINGSYYLDWDYNSSSWDYESVSYNTGAYTEIELMWRYASYSYGYAYIDNIQVTW